MLPLRHTIQRLIRDAQGAVLVFWAILFGVMLGFVAIAVDTGRIGVTQSELQAYADNVALAAAMELDGKSDSITRAELAASTLISDSTAFGDGGATLSGAADYTILFYEDLPNDDSPPTGATTTPGDANYVEVTVNAHSVETPFWAAFAAVTGQPSPTAAVSARAVAGLDSVICDITPLMFCLPDAWDDPKNPAEDIPPGVQILLRSGGGGSGAWAPGTFGFLDPSNVVTDLTGTCAGLTGGNLDRCLLGAVIKRTACFDYDGVDVEPGQKVGNYEAALNTRFDLYNSSMNGFSNNADYAPAPNVIKGIIPNGGGSCIGNNEQISPNTIGLPRDSCFGAGFTCAGSAVGPRFGNGNWDRDLYWSENYFPFDPGNTVMGDNSEIPPLAIQNALVALGTTYSTASRWQVYQAEIAAGSPTRILEGEGPGSAPPYAGSDGSAIAETGRPVCNTQSNPDVDIYRRVVVAAGIDCDAVSPPLGGAATGVEVAKFVEIFLTEPASNNGSGNDFDIWGEVIGTASVGAGGGGGNPASVLQDIVQLYQ